MPKSPIYVAITNGSLKTLHYLVENGITSVDIANEGACSLLLMLLEGSMSMIVLNSSIPSPLVGSISQPGDVAISTIEFVLAHGVQWSSIYELGTYGRCSSYKIRV